MRSPEISKVSRLYDKPNKNRAFIEIQSQAENLITLSRLPQVCNLWLYRIDRTIEAINQITNALLFSGT
jgi:hypothetical protein